MGVEVEKDLKLCSLLGVPCCGKTFTGVDLSERRALARAAEVWS